MALRFVPASVLLWVLAVFVTLGSGQAARKHKNSGHWVATWTTMPQLTEPHNLPPAPFTSTTSVFANATVRQTLHMSIGGESIRLRISNVFGTTSLPITAVTVGLPVNGTAGVNGVVPDTLQRVTFSGQESFSLPNGALALSDPVQLTVEPESIITVSIYLADGQLSNDNTGHPGSRTTSWMALGNQVDATELTGDELASVLHWYYVSAVDVWSPKASSSFAIIGDSITDGRGSDNDQNNRWPDLVLARMQQNGATSNIGVVNQAAGGNRILADGLGPNTLSRIERDVISQPGMKYAMIFEGVNDIGTSATNPAAQKAVGDGLIWAFKQIAARIHAAEMPLFAATITSFSSPSGDAYYSDPMREETRQRVNEFIRSSGIFEVVVDFDEILRNETHPSYLKDIYHDGDYLHPNHAGYQAMAEAFPLDIFSRFSGRVGGYA